MTDGDPPDEGWANIRTAALRPEQMEQPPAGPEQAYLIVIAGNRVGEMVKLEDALTIGRGGDADFVVTDDGVSRRHLTVETLEDGRAQVVDLGSANGTFVNRERIDRVVLNDGDKIHIGSTVILKFSYSDKVDEDFQKQMLQAAMQDPLTGLYNRRYLEEQLEAEFRFVSRQGGPLTLLMMDLDHFKQVNDNHGHPVGDAVLRGFAASLRAGIRGEDIAARYGGEEFVVICRATQEAVGVKIAERLRQRLEQLQLVNELPDLRVTVSIGVASLPNARITTTRELVEKADKALYVAKANGRNQVCALG
jgi:two-component system cell cycle response regulator